MDYCNRKDMCHPINASDLTFMWVTWRGSYMIWYLVWVFLAYIVTTVLIWCSYCTFQNTKKKFEFSFSSSEVETSETFKFEKIHCFTYQLWREQNFTSREYFSIFYFSLICRLYVGTFAIWMTPKVAYQYSLVLNKCPSAY